MILDKEGKNELFKKVEFIKKEVVNNDSLLKGI